MILLALRIVLEPVGDDEGRAALHDGIQRLLNQVFRFGIHYEDVASSRMRMRGSVMIARARARRCFCPPLSRTPRSPIRFRTPWACP